MGRQTVNTVGDLAIEVEANTHGTKLYLPGLPGIP